MAESGGLTTVRDEGVLEAVMGRPESGYYSGLLEEAAALIESMVIDHPFMDGNKRVAVAIADLFLRHNGFRLKCDADETDAHFRELIGTRTFNFCNILSWLTDHVESHPDLQP